MKETKSTYSRIFRLKLWLNTQIPLFLQSTLAHTKQNINKTRKGCQSQQIVFNYGQNANNTYIKLSILLGSIKSYFSNVDIYFWNNTKNYTQYYTINRIYHIACSSFFVHQWVCDRLSLYDLCLVILLSSRKVTLYMM